MATEHAGDKIKVATEILKKYFKAEPKVLTKNFDKSEKTWVSFDPEGKASLWEKGEK